MEKLDDLVIGAHADQLFTQERLELLLARVMDVSDKARERQRNELERSQSALGRLLDLVAQGLMGLRDPARADKLAEHKMRIAT